MMRRSPLPVADALAGAQLLWKLPFFLRREISLEQANAIVDRRLEQRQADFLALAHRAIYAQATSPYRQLLSLAGCEYGDLERLVMAEGVEGALRTLFKQGVHLTLDEFKGRTRAVRGSATVEVRPEHLRNPELTIGLPRYTSGSRGPSAPAPFDLKHVLDRAVGIRLYLEARGARNWRHATWEAPGGGSTVHLLEYTLAGAPMVRWFTPIAPRASNLHPRYRWIGRVLRLGGLLAGRPQPIPTHAPFDAPLAIGRWMSTVLREGGTPHLLTYSSCGVRLCQAADEAGIDLRGARLTLVGEPFTPARQETIRQAGVDAVPRYGSAEASAIGSGCLAPRASDDMHLLDDLNAVIQPGADGKTVGLPPRALLFSSLRPATPVILLNVSLGDQADLVERRCGCPMERYGWLTHLETIRSFEKLTAGGMTFLDTDVVRALEEVLPARFGGGPIDYQLVEDETRDGRSLVRLLVNPAVGPVDIAMVADVFLSAIASGSEAQRLMAMQWREAGFPIVERRVPCLTGSGKILHLHQVRSPSGNGKE